MVRMGKRRGIPAPPTTLNAGKSGITKEGLH